MTQYIVLLVGCGLTGLLSYLLVRHDVQGERRTFEEFVKAYQNIGFTVRGYRLVGEEVAFLDVVIERWYFTIPLLLLPPFCFSYFFSSGAYGVKFWIMFILLLVAYFLEAYLLLAMSPTSGNSIKTLIKTQSESLKSIDDDTFKRMERDNRIVMMAALYLALGNAAFVLAVFWLFRIVSVAL